MIVIENFCFLGKGKGGGGSTSYGSRDYSRGGGESMGRGCRRPGGRGGEGLSIGGMCSSIPAAASTVRIALLISLSGLHISVTVYSTILS